MKSKKPKISLKNRTEQLNPTGVPEAPARLDKSAKQLSVVREDNKGEQASKSYSDSSVCSNDKHDATNAAFFDVDNDDNALSAMVNIKLLEKNTDKDTGIVEQGEDSSDSSDNDKTKDDPFEDTKVIGNAKRESYGRLTS